MFSAIENERLAASKRLETIYKRDAERAISQIDTYWTNLAAQEENRYLDVGISAYPDIVRHDAIAGAFIWDDKGTLSYPHKLTLGASPLPFSLDWRKAQYLEFQEKNFAEAQQAYLKLIESTSQADKIKALLAIARCEFKQGNHLEAFEHYESLSRINTSISITKQTEHSLVINGLVRALEIATKENTPRPTLGAVENILTILERTLNDYGNQPISSRQRLYSMNKLTGMSQSFNNIYGIEGKPLFKTHMAEKFINSDIPPRRLNNIRDHWPDQNTLVLTGPNERISLLVKRSLFDSNVKETLVEYVHGPHPTIVIRTNQEPIPDSNSDIFYEKTLSGTLSGLTVYLYADNSKYFERENAARIGIYLGTGSSIILLLIVSSLAVLIRMRGQERLNQLKSDVMATVSHELRTPLSSVKLLVENMIEGSDITDPKTLEYIHIIGEENERLTRLVNNFLEFARIDRDKYAFNFEHIKTQDVVNMAVKAIKHRFDQAGAELTLAAEHEETWIYADADKLCITLINLLENAFKYTGQNKHIGLSVEKHSEYVFIKLSDNGVGISEKDKKKIFDQFYRVDQNLNRSTEGCGLGLYIASFIVRAHGGDILVKSKPGEGSVFTIKIPASTTEQ